MPQLCSCVDWGHLVQLILWSVIGVCFQIQMGVEPKIVFFSPKKWMVYFMENLIKMDDLGGTPIFGNTQIYPNYIC